MLKNGIVSVTFRASSIDEVIELAAKASLSCIEVGSDVHAPKENIAECCRIARIAEEKGIEIVSYGSYYRLGEYASSEEEFNGYIAAADSLGAKNIRIWAGNCSSQAVQLEKRRELVGEARLLAKMAKAHKKTISFEYHPGTLTDRADSARRLIEETACENVSLYWQPDQSLEIEQNCDALKLVLPYVSSLHVFAWDARSGSCIRYMLSEHESAWRRYLDILSSDGREHTLLMEFVKDDRVENFLTDARTLNEWRMRYV